MNLDGLHLKSLGDSLNQAGYTTSIVPPSSEVPFEQLYIILEADSQGRPRAMQLQYVPVEASAHGDHLLQIVSTLPFQYNAGLAGDVARMILLVNKILELPGFGLSEADKACYYHYVHICPKGEINGPLLLDLLPTFIHYVDEFGPVIEDIASGNKTHQEAIEEMLGELPADVRAQVSL